MLAIEEFLEVDGTKLIFKEEHDILTGVQDPAVEINLRTLEDPRVTYMCSFLKPELKQNNHSFLRSQGPRGNAYWLSSIKGEPHKRNVSGRYLKEYLSHQVGNEE
ncbi:hypothetical protein JCGZ_20205 [Jatropha curcas]|uniref:Uncharacterized protein n=1 Tax=Jatropha curcas TaxID=180498 RepID=A0A067K5J6_JATCU|nr:hypothetical protein JCGZ_20205 [Jatropha curcas]